MPNQSPSPGPHLPTTSSSPTNASAATTLGWRAKTRLEQGLTQAYGWYREALAKGALQGGRGRRARPEAARSPLKTLLRYAPLDLPFRGEGFDRPAKDPFMTGGFLVALCPCLLRFVMRGSSDIRASRGKVAAAP
jgi:hypothetical protein